MGKHCHDYDNAGGFEPFTLLVRQMGGQNRSGVAMMWREISREAKEGQTKRVAGNGGKKWVSYYSNPSK